MTELRRRGVGDPDSTENISDKEADGDDKLGFPGEGEGEMEGDSKADTPDVPPSTDNTPQCLNKALEGLSSRWKNWWIRGILSLTMINGFFLIIYLGPIMLILVVMSIQIKCFHEIITIGYRVYRSYDLPWFRTLSWILHVCTEFSEETLPPAVLYVCVDPCDLVACGDSVTSGYSEPV